MRVVAGRNITAGSTQYAGSEVGRYSRAYRGYFLALMVTVSAFAIIDRVALLTVGQAVSYDLKLSDFQFGLASGFAFAVVYAVLGLPLARVAESRDRVKLIAIAVAIWSAFSLLSGFARNFLQLLLCRVVIGVGEAGVQPPAIAIISDLYPPGRRGTALAVLSVGLPIGSLIGAAGAGYLAGEYSWRTVFLLLGVPGVVLAIVARLTLRDPPRGLSEGETAQASEPIPSTRDVFRHLWARISFRHIVAALAMTYFAAAGIGSFVPQYFARVYNLPLGKSGLLFGLVGASSSLVGNLTGGMVVDWISRRDRRWYTWLPAFGVLVAAPLYLAAFAIGVPIFTTGLLVVAGVFMFLHYAPSQAVLQNMVKPRMRATAAFIFFFIVSMLGYGVGPTLLGLISDGLARHEFTVGDYVSMCPGGAARSGAAVALASACHAAAAAGIRGAMIVMSCLFFWAALHFWLAARTVRSDLNIVDTGAGG
jgi:predicted MFS family arabinose efflux permease